MVYGYFTKLNGERSFPRMQHGQAHFKAGRDLLDLPFWDVFSLKGLFRNDS